MHSMFVHFADVGRDELAEYFDTHAVRGLREHWYHPTRTDPAFSARFPHEGAEFRDDENRRHVAQVLGGEPASTVQFDVGGKRPGHKELRQFLARLLAIHPGVALDDLSPHIWTLDDLRADRHVDGFAFADHESYRKLHTTHHHATHPPGKPDGNGSSAH
jgi:hypothetical protein